MVSRRRKRVRTGRTTGVKSGRLPIQSSEVTISEQDKELIAAQRDEGLARKKQLLAEYAAKSKGCSACGKRKLAKYKKSLGL